MDDWVSRFTQATGQAVPAERLYNEVVSLSTKTTFDAIAQALMTAALTDEFRRRADNSVYHKGVPIDYRGQGGVPSIQFSVALDERRADIDVELPLVRVSSRPVRGQGSRS